MKSTYQTILFKLLILISVLFTVFAEACPNVVRSFILKSGESRLCTVVNKQPYYKSTGTNSHSKDTVFPFIGIDRLSLNYIKPNMDNSKHVMLELIQSNFIDRIKSNQVKIKFINILELYNNLHPGDDCYGKDWTCGMHRDRPALELFLRLYSLEDATMSYRFGTGFWQKPTQDLEIAESALLYLVKATISNSQCIRFPDLTKQADRKYIEWEQELNIDTVEDVNKRINGFNVIF